MARQKTELANLGRELLLEAIRAIAWDQAGMRLPREGRMPQVQALRILERAHDVGLGAFEHVRLPFLRAHLEGRGQ